MGDPFNIFGTDMEEVSEGLLEGAQPPERELPGGDVRVFVFDSLDDVFEGAHKLAGSSYGKSSLYKNTAEKKYYLLLDGTGCDRIMFSSTCNVLSEYGKQTRHNYSSKAYFDEHYELIIGEDALEKLGGI